MGENTWKNKYEFKSQMKISLQNLHKWMSVLDYETILNHVFKQVESLKEEKKLHQIDAKLRSQLKK
jgi:hypothetical protein